MAGIFFGAGQALVGATATAIGTVATGGAGVYGAVTGDHRPARDLARATRQCAEVSGEGAAMMGRGVTDVGRATVVIGTSHVVPVGLLISAPSLTGFAYACAKTSYLAYTPYNERPSSFTDREGDTWTEMRPKNCPCQYDTDYMTIYQCGSDIIIGNRGTDPCDVSDLMSDACIVLGGIPPGRCEEAERVAMGMRRSNRYRNIYLTGHSLGGNIALYVGLRQGFRVHCFNPGASVHDSLSHAIVAMAGGSASTTINVHRIFDDYVSACVTSSSRVVVHDYGRSTVGSSHGMHQFFGA